MISLYALSVLIVGIRASGGVGGGEDPLLARRNVPVGAVFASLVATELSAATFIGVPDSAIRNASWAYLQFAAGALLAKWLLARTLVPLYHSLKVVTVYGLIDGRFGREARRATAMTFIVGRVIASGVRLYIAALAFGIVSGIPLEVTIFLCAIIAGAYSMRGGIKSVIWTDVLQGGVLLCGAFIVLGVLLWKIDGGVVGLANWIRDTGNAQVIFFPTVGGPEGSRWGDLLGNASLFPTALIGGFFLTLATHGTDHDMVQRLLTTRDSKGAGRALITSGVINLPLTALFLLLGTGIACLWQMQPPGFDTSEDNRVFPLFVLHQIPSGLRGLVLAGLFAAAMSSLDSALCAISSTWTVDIREVPEGGSRARSVRVGTGVLVMVLAITACAFGWLEESEWSPAGDLVSLALSAMTIVYGGLLGVFLCAAFFPRRGNSGTAIGGLVVGGALGFGLFLQKMILGVDEPLIAWPWWIVITSSISLSICALGATGASRKASA